MSTLIFKKSWTALVFEGRNKQYGAYVLRQDYDQNLVRALFLGTISVAGLVCISFFLQQIPSLTQATLPVEKEHIIQTYTIPIPKATQPQVLDNTKKTDLNKPMVVKKDVEPINMPVTNTPFTPNQPVEPINGIPNGGPGIIQPVPTDPLPITEPEVVPYNVEVMPIFSQGNIKQFIADHFVFTREALDAGINIKTYACFTVNKDGSVSDVKILKPVGYGLDKEIERVLLLSKWTPGSQRGESMRVKCTIPIQLTVL